MFDPDASIARIEQHAAKVVLRNALTLQAAHKRNVSVANPVPHNNPSKRGEFHKSRTFNARDCIVVEPTSLAVIEQTGTARCGILLNAFYVEILRRKGWKGLIDTHRELLARGAYK